MITKFLLSLIFVFIVSMGVVLSARHILKDKLVTLAQKKCPKCDFKIQSIDLNPLNTRVTLNQFSLDIHSGTDLIRIQCGALDLKFKLKSLFAQVREISTLTLSKLHVTVISKRTEDKKDPDPKELEEIESSYGGKFLESLPELILGHIKIEDSEFEHILEIFNQKATLRVSQINADISELGTRKELSPPITKIILTGIFQKSGDVLIKLNADLFSIKNHDELEISVKNQEMTDLDTFFFVEDGLKFKGKVDEIRTVLNIRSGHLTGNLIANYHDLEMTASETPETGKFKAALITFVQKIKMAKTKPDPKKPTPIAAVNYARKPGEGLIRFLLSGLKEAAFKVISN